MCPFGFPFRPAIGCDKPIIYHLIDLTQPYGYFFLLQRLYLVEQGLIGGCLLVTGSVGEIEFVEQSFRAGDLAVLNPAQFETVHRAFGFGDEEQVLETAVVAEGHSPVGA